VAESEFDRPRVNPRRVAETLLTSHVADTQDQIHLGEIRAHLRMLASNGLITEDRIEPLADEIDDLISTAAAEDRITVTIRDN
jgi:uncharacterized tellurite resistance protein B-like protein